MILARISLCVPEHVKKLLSLMLIILHFVLLVNHVYTPLEYFARQ